MLKNNEKIYNYSKNFTLTTPTGEPMQVTEKNHRSNFKEHEILYKVPRKGSQYFKNWLSIRNLKKAFVLHAF